jgi:hypothetical protein
MILRTKNIALFGLMYFNTILTHRTMLRSQPDSAALGMMPVLIS